MVLVLVVVASSADAHDLTSGAQLGVSRAYDPAVTGEERWTVWARRLDGHLISRYDDPTASYVWTDQNAPVTVSINGVSATGWIEGANVREFAFYVGTNGTAYRRALVNRAGGTWLSLPNQQFGTLTGHVAATWATTDVGRVLQLYATTTNGYLLVCEEVMSTGVRTWYALGALGYSTTAPLAASRAPSGNYAHIYAPMVDGSLTLWLFKGPTHTWQFQGLQKPGGLNGCGTLAAAEDTISTYRAFVFCTRTGATNDRIYYRYATSESTTTMTSWASIAVPTGTVANTGYALAATSRGDATGRAIDLWALGAEVPNVVFKSTVVGAALPTTPVAASPDRENLYRYGGLAAVPQRLQNFSRVFYLGRGDYSSVRRLYQRSGNLASNGPSAWANHQLGSPLQTVSGTAAPLAETSTAMFRGRAITAAINRPGPGEHDYARIMTFWSDDDGETWGPAHEITVPGYEYLSDPTVAFTSSGVAYVVVLAVNFVQHLCHWPDNSPGSNLETGVFYFTTDDGSLFSAPIALREDTNSTGDLDHPWIDIYHNPNGADRIHVAWARSPVQPGDDPSQIEHVTKLTTDQNWSAIHVLTEEGGGAPTLTTGFAGQTYVAWADHLCRLVDGSFDQCTYQQIEGALPYAFVGQFASDGGTMPDIPGTTMNLEIGNPWSVKASPNYPDRVFYAFQKKGTEIPNRMNVWASVGAFMGGNDFSFSAPVLVDPSQLNDGYDQFAPALTVSGDDAIAYDTVFVSYYDQATAGLCNGFPNRCLRARRATSRTLALSFTDLGFIPIDTSNSVIDPAELPYHCRKVGIRFIGDYHEVTGDVLHSRHVIVGAPLGAPTDGVGILSTSWTSGGYFHW